MTSSLPTMRVNLRNHNFGPFHLALAMCTLPKFVSTFFVLQPLPQNALGHDFFNSAVPWTDKLLFSDQTSGQQYCNECASSSSFLVNTSAASRLVWLQYIREYHPPANTYRNFLGKDSLFSSGYSWQCVALIIHQGHDPLNGDQQPAEHFYVLENDGPKCKFMLQQCCGIALH